MGYAIPRIQKLKSAKQLADSYMNNTRIYDVINADPVKKRDNVDLGDQLLGRSYQDVCEDTLRHLKIIGAQNRAVRHDAIRGLEVMLTYSREDVGRVDVTEWARVSVDWIRKTFNPPGHQITFRDPETGQFRSEKIDNVKSAILHMDEKVPHIHAFIVPIDSSGHLNAHYYTRDRSQLIDMQTSYAEAMKPFGLKRGARHSVAHHEEQAEYYRRLLEPLREELPSVRNGETADQYRLRANEVYRSALVNCHEELRKVNQKAAHAREKVVDEKRDLQQRILAFETGKKRLASLVGMEELTPEGLSEVKRLAEMQKSFEEGLKQYPDREKAQSAKEAYEEMVDWIQSRKRLEREKKSSAERQKKSEQSETIRYGF